MIIGASVIVEPIQFHFLPQDFNPETWESIEPYIETLQQAEIADLDTLKNFLSDYNELVCAVTENYYWRYVRMTCDTANADLEAHHNAYTRDIQPKMTEFINAVNKKIVELPFAATFNEPGFSVALKRMKTDIELFHPDNPKLNAEINEKVTESAKIRGAQTVFVDGKELALPLANDYLYSDDRAKREEVWRSIRERSYDDRDRLDAIYHDLVALRVKTAHNAGFENYRDFRFQELKRYDYTPQHCYDFHDAVAKEVSPLLDMIEERRRSKLGVETLRPWDLFVDPEKLPTIQAFNNEEELIEKSIHLLKELDDAPYNIACAMKKMNRLDSMARKNKRPGAYMIQMPVSRVPFNFGNLTGKATDLVTFMHEMGHATHGFLVKDMPLQGYKEWSVEAGELAAMTMELLTRDHWHVFFKNEDECRRAKLDHLENIVTHLPWAAQMDAFQHKVYLQPDATPGMRHDMWREVLDRFPKGVLNISGLEKYYDMQWHRTPHIFFAPFYYIEYGIAQLGALQIWRNYTQDKKQALAQYKNALALGATKSVPEIYETAGIRFDFSAPMIKDLMAFVRSELDALN